MIVKIDDQNRLTELCGANDCNLQLIEQMTGDRIFSYGNEIIIEVENENKEPVYNILLSEIANEITTGNAVSKESIQSLLDVIQNGDRLQRKLFSNQFITVSSGVKVFPRTVNQAEYMNAMNKFDISVGIGPAGTGKTYLAVAYALSMIISTKKRKLLLTRPVVESGGSQSFHHGDLSPVIDPYLRPIYDVMDFLIGAEKVAELEEKRMIEVAPLDSMRGRSLNECIVILDEAQNSTRTQMKMFLTRLGEDSQAIITGDITQIDLPKDSNSGLIHAMKLLRSIDGIHFSLFKREDVVRNPLVRKIIKAYENEGL